MAVTLPHLGWVTLRGEHTGRRHRKRLQRQGRLLFAPLTIAWNVIEGVVAITAGIAAGSIALVGFGIDCRREWP